MDKAFKNGPSKICERQPLKKLNGMVSFKQTIGTTFLSFRYFTWPIFEYFVSHVEKTKQQASPSPTARNSPELVTEHQTV